MKHSLRWLVLLALFLTTISPSSAQENKYWNWSDPSAAHHSAVRVMVEEPNGAKKYASGIYIEYGKLKGVLTVKHLMRDVQDIRVITQNGDISTACSTAWTDRDGHDFSFVTYQNKNLTPLSIAEVGPIPGQRYEIIPLTDSKKKGISVLRAFYMNCVESLNPTGQKSHNLDYYDGYTISGDSGSGILNSKHQVVGIQSAGYEFTGTSIGVKRLHRGSVSSKHTFLVAFLNRLQTHETQLG